MLLRVLKSELNRRVNSELTLDEARAITSYKVREFLKGNGKRVLVIMSPAGSGKSAIVNKIVNRHLTPQGKKLTQKIDRK